MRALAHPLRWKLLDVLLGEVRATATRCAELLGESQASCSYHLGILAQYGYVRQVAVERGRDRPWELTSTAQSFDVGGQDVEGKLAANAARDVFLDNELFRLKEGLARADGESAGWQPSMTGETIFVTAAEYEELKRELRAVALRYDRRSSDPSLRPPAGRKVRLFVTAFAAPAAPSPAPEDE